MADEKSVLDNIPVTEQGFPIPTPRNPLYQKPLSIVGHCPNCGSPIYGLRDISTDNELKEVKLTCDCKHAGRVDYPTTMKTK